MEAFQQLALGGAFALVICPVLIVSVMILVRIKNWLDNR